MRSALSPDNHLMLHETAVSGGQDEENNTKFCRDDVAIDDTNDGDRAVDRRR